MDRRDLYDPTVSTLPFRAYYTTHVVLLLACYFVLVPAATGAYDAFLVRFGLRPALSQRIIPNATHQPKQLAATAAANAGPGGARKSRDGTLLRRLCWWPRHPAVVCGVTFLLATVAVQLQAFGRGQVVTLLLPTSLIGWAIAASRVTRGVSHPHTRRRSLAVFLGITAAGGGTLGATALHPVSHSTSVACL